MKLVFIAAVFCHGPDGHIGLGKIIFAAFQPGRNHIPNAGNAEEFRVKLLEMGRAQSQGGGCFFDVPPFVGRTVDRGAQMMESCIILAAFQRHKRSPALCFQAV